MYPWRHFSLWTDPNNLPLLKMVYDKTESEMVKYPELIKKLIQTTYRCSWCLVCRPLTESMSTTYIEMTVIACNPMKYLLNDDLIMCKHCLENKTRPFTLPEPNYRFYRPSLFGLDSMDISRSCPLRRRNIGQTQLIISTGYNSKPKIENYFTLVSAYYMGESDVKTRSKFMKDLHPRYQIDMCLFDILYINLIINIYNVV
jgi:hypothetical protein